MTQDRVSATETSVEILEALADLETAGVTELAQVVDGSKANVHKHLATLDDAGLVRKRGDHYSLGHRFLSFASTAKRTEPVYREGHTHLAKLADVAEATATLVVREGTDAVYLHSVSPTPDTATAPPDGTRIPLHESGGGLAILSCYDTDERRAILGETLESVDRIDDVLSRLDTARQRGTIVDRDEAAGVSEIVAPVTTADGRPAGAVGLRYATAAGTDRREADRRKLVRNTATTVSKRLGLTR
jgi:IclR family acetate operon transcriptional repressor